MKGHISIAFILPDRDCYTCERCCNLLEYCTCLFCEACLNPIACQCGNFKPFTPLRRVSLKWFIHPIISGKRLDKIK